MHVCRPPAELEGLGRYEYGWADSDTAGATARRGLSEDVVRNISALKSEPEWMLKHAAQGAAAVRQEAHAHVGQRPVRASTSTTSSTSCAPPRSRPLSWDDLPDDIKRTYDRLGIPEAEKQRLVAGVAAQYESEVVYHQIREDLEEQGVIFLDTDTALREHEDLFREYFGTVIPAGDNKFAALNTAVWSGGSFIYVPKGVHVEIPLQAYFRINTENMGQFERTLIIADEGSYVHYVEGCTAPIYKSDSLHSAVVEIIVKKNARVRYTTIQNWSNNVYNLVTKRAAAARGRHHGVGRRQHRLQGDDEVPGGLPARRARQGRDAVDRLRRRGPAPGRRREDGARGAAHVLVDRLQVGRPRRWPHLLPRLVQVLEGAHHSRSTVRCDALLVDTISRSDTYPYVDVREDDVSMGHEATVSKVSEEQLFYLMSRGHGRGRGHGDDRARLHRADRPRAADGVRARAQPADRAADGRGRRLMAATTSGVVRTAPTTRATAPGTVVAGNASAAHSHGAGVPVSSRGERPTLRRRPTSRCPPAARRTGGSRRCDRLRGLQLGRRPATPGPSCRWTPPPRSGWRPSGASDPRLGPRAACPRRATAPPRSRRPAAHGAACSPSRPRRRSTSRSYVRGQRAAAGRGYGHTLVVGRAGRHGGGQ